MKNIIVFLITLLLILWAILSSCSTYIQKSGIYYVQSCKENTYKLTRYTWWYREYTPVKGRYIINNTNLKPGDSLYVSITHDTTFINIYPKK